MKDAKQPSARWFLEWVLGTEERELDCAGLIDIVDRFVDHKVRGMPDAADFALVPHHLRQCPDCARLVAALTEMVGLEEAGALPPLDRLWIELRRSIEPDSAGRQTGHKHRESNDPRRAWGPTFSLPRLALGRSLAAWKPLSAILAIALVGAVSAWWHSDHEARIARDIVRHLSEAALVRSAEMVDGSRATVYFSPNDRRALVHLILNRSPNEPARIRCWLTGDHQSARPQETSCGRAAAGWWYVMCEQPLANYERLALSLEPKPAATVELRLRPEASR